MLKQNILKFYAKNFSGVHFIKFNKFLYQLSLRGLGILDIEGSDEGEKNWLKNCLIDVTAPIVIDVGANQGDYVLDILETNPQTKIYAFEPHPITFKKMLSRITSQNFFAYNLAVGKQADKLTLYDYADNDGSQHASLYKNVIEKIHGGKSMSYEVDVISLDDFAESNDISTIHLLKIDTEGNELQVLKGCKDLLKNRRIKTIQFEFNEMNVESGSHFKDFWELLLDFDLYRVQRRNLLPIQHYIPLTCEIYAYQNIVAILKEPTEVKIEN